MGLSDSLIIPGLMLGEIAQRSKRKIRASRLFHWPVSLHVPSRFSHALDDLQPADPKQAGEFYNGNFTLGHQSVATGGESPFTHPSPDRKSVV